MEAEPAAELHAESPCVGSVPHASRPESDVPHCAGSLRATQSTTGVAKTFLST